ncbi:MAG: hypothetical protein AAFR59_15240, partial [Bacteroidota bacterium]
MRHILTFFLTLCTLTSLEAQVQRANYRTLYQKDVGSRQWDIVESSYIQTSTRARAIDYSFKRFIADPEDAQNTNRRYRYNAAYHDIDSTRIKTQEIWDYLVFDHVSYYENGIYQYDLEGKNYHIKVWYRTVDRESPESNYEYIVCRDNTFNLNGDIVLSVDTVRDSQTEEIERIERTSYEYVYDDNGCKLQRTDTYQGTPSGRVLFQVGANCETLEEVEQDYNSAIRNFINKTRRTNEARGDTLFTYLQQWDAVQANWGPIETITGAIQRAGISYEVFEERRIDWKTRTYDIYSNTGTYIGSTEEWRLPDDSGWYVHNREQMVYESGNLIREEYYRNFNLEAQTFNNIDTVL